MSTPEAPHPARDVEAWVALANEAAADQRWTDALAYTERALAFARTSSRLFLNKAFFCERLGRFEEALAAFEAAAWLSPEDGEADFNLALFLEARGHPADALEPAVLRALAKSPDLAEEILVEGLFPELLGRERVRAALRDATARPRR